MLFDCELGVKCFILIIRPAVIMDSLITGVHLCDKEEYFSSDLIVKDKIV